MTKTQSYYGTGRRKTSIARVFLLPGSGKIIVNKRDLDDYFHLKTAQMIIKQPLVLTDILNRFDIIATVVGGGSNGQAGAVRLGIARAIVDYENQTSSEQETAKPLHKVLRTAGLLTRDSRAVERKKVGRHKARKGTQYSKR